MAVAEEIRKMVSDHLEMQERFAAAVAQRPPLRHQLPAYEHAAEVLRQVLKEIDERRFS